MNGSRTQLVLWKYLQSVVKFPPEYGALRLEILGFHVATAIPLALLQISALFNRNVRPNSLVNKF